MRDIGPAHHAAEDRAQPRVVEHLLGEDDEGLMHIMLWYGSGDAVQVSRSHVQKALSRSGLTVAYVIRAYHEETTIRRVGRVSRAKNASSSARQMVNILLELTNRIALFR